MENLGKIPPIVERLARELPHFPDGRIDYRKSEIAPVVTIFIQYKGKILLLKRSDKVGAYRGKWNTVSGFLDKPEPVSKKAAQELKEELTIGSKDIISIKEGRPYEFFDEEAKKTWVVHPVLVELRNQPQISLDWEHTEYVWIKTVELKNYETVPKLDESLNRVISL